MIAALQVLFLVCIVVALVALTDWRWGLLAAGVVGFAASFQAERQTNRKSEAG